MLSEHSEGVARRPSAPYPETLSRLTSGSVLMADFYGALAPYHHLIYPDWEASLQSQGRALATIIRSYGGEHLLSVLDAACGVGTQSLGLARIGYQVTALPPSSWDT